MKFERKIDKNKLKDLIKKHYNIDVLDFQFLPKGEGGYSYIIDCQSNIKYFLKIYPSNKANANTDLEENLKIIESLSSQAKIKNISQIVKTKNNYLRSKFNNEDLVIFEYIFGKDLGDQKISNSIITKIAELLSQIHRTTSQIKPLKLQKEKFDINYEKDLIKTYKKLEKIPTTSKYQKKLKQYLIDNKSNILDVYKKLKGFQGKAKNSQKKFTITHGDPIPHNLILDQQNNIHLIDWETSMLAPAERDVWFYLENHGQEFIKAYKETNDLQLDINIIGFYFYNRNLEDLMDWVQRIFYENKSDEQDKNDFCGILEDCDFFDLEKRLEKIKKIM